MKLDASKEFEVFLAYTENILMHGQLAGDDEVIVDLVGSLAAAINKVFDAHKGPNHNNAHGVLMREAFDKRLMEMGFKRLTED